ncbi:MAG TPA: hypothetical protein ENN21_09320 [Spirochaetes bacterium]|nr:hypothetical protein [Spirochaetota bacterium]
MGLNQKFLLKCRNNKNNTRTKLAISDPTIDGSDEGGAIYGDEAALVKEILTGIFRAGADMVISYHTRDVLAKGWG